MTNCENDEEVVSAAVQSCPSALEYASPDLRNNREIVLAVVQRDGELLTYASPQLQEDREIQLAAYKALLESPYRTTSTDRADTVRSLMKQFGNNEEPTMDSSAIIQDSDYDDVNSLHLLTFGGFAVLIIIIIAILRYKTRWSVKPHQR